jgi:hypothetical protein
MEADAMDFSLCFTRDIRLLLRRLLETLADVSRAIFGRFHAAAVRSYV